MPNPAIGVQAGGAVLGFLGNKRTADKNAALAQQQMAIANRPANIINPSNPFDPQGNIIGSKYDPGGDSYYSPFWRQMQRGYAEAIPGYQQQRADLTNPFIQNQQAALTGFRGALTPSLNQYLGTTGQAVGGVTGDLGGIRNVFNQGMGDVIGDLTGNQSAYIQARLNPFQERAAQQQAAYRRQAGQYGLAGSSIAGAQERNIARQNQREIDAVRAQALGQQAQIRAGLEQQRMAGSSIAGAQERNIARQNQREIDTVRAQALQDQTRLRSAYEQQRAATGAGLAGQMYQSQMGAAGQQYQAQREAQNAELAAQSNINKDVLNAGTAALTEIANMGTQGFNMASQMLSEDRDLMNLNLQSRNAMLGVLQNMQQQNYASQAANSQILYGLGGALGGGNEELTNPFSGWGPWSNPMGGPSGATGPFAYNYGR